MARPATPTGTAAGDPATPCLQRPGNAAEAARLERLAAEALGQRAAPWRAADLVALAASGHGAILADPALERGLVLLSVAAGEAEILDLGVVPAARRRGLGRALLAAALAEAAARGAVALFLEVAVDNDAARALYRGAGFAAVGRRPGYYPRPAGDAVDALVLRLALA